MTKHTPLPWHYEADRIWQIGDEYTTPVVYIDTHKPEQNKANGQFIVRACNSHYELLAAAKKALEFMENIQFNDTLTEHEQAVFDAAQAAIKKAKGAE